MKQKARNPKNGAVGRRRFLKRAAAGAAMLAGSSVPASITEASGSTKDSETRSESVGVTHNTSEASRTIEHPGSDYMVDVFRALDIEYCASNCGSSFDGLQESIVNYGANRLPEFLTCLHEESAVAMAHGYAKIAGKPMMALFHGTVGLQHAAMAIYNAYVDRVPVYMAAGLDYDGPVSAHNATDLAALVRDYIKWDHQPGALRDFGRSAVRAYTLATTPPMAPVLLVLDAKLQKEAADNPPKVPKISVPKFPSADIGSVREIAGLLLAAENPRINTGQVARTQEGLDLLVELAELLQVPVNGVSNRLNFPSRHPLQGTGTGTPDLILNLEPGSRVGTSPSSPRSTGRQAQATDAPSVTTITISSAEFLVTSNFNVFGNGAGNADLVVAADAQSTLPALIEEVRRLMTSDRKAFLQDRGTKIANAHLRARRRTITDARYGWDNSPVSLPRLAAEVWPHIKDLDWSFVSPQRFLGNWPSHLWDMNKTYHFIGAHGAGGMGYGAPAAVGAALANRKHGRISINIQGDGDLNYAPGVLWTAAHHQIPLLTIVANNRAYHAEVMFLQKQCAARNRGVDRADIGTTIKDPNISYSQMAKAYGVYGEGPIDNPRDLGPALRRALERVKAGEPAVLDVLTQPRG